MKDSEFNGEQLNREHKILFKNTFYVYLNNYSSYLLSIVTSFIIARIISQEQWGFLILANSYIIIISLIISFLPPGLEHSLSFYISQYSVLSEKGKIKKLIKHAFTQKLIFLIPAFIITLLIFHFFAGLFKINLDVYSGLLYILSPLIIINGLNSVVLGINRGFFLFKKIFILLIIKYGFNIGALVYIFLFMDNVNINTIAIINTASIAIPFVINGVHILIKYMRMRNFNENRLTFKDSLLQSLNYGGYISIRIIMNQAWEQLQIQSIGIFERPEVVTGYNIGIHFTQVPRIISAMHPLTLTFTRLATKKEYSRINKIFNLALNYTNFLYLLINGLFYIIADLFLVLIYGRSYIVFSNILKFMLISFTFIVLNSQFSSMIHATKKVKLAPLIQLLNLIITIPIFFIGLIFFNLEIALIFISIGNFIVFLIRTILCFRIFKIKLEVKKLFLQYFIFLFSLSLTIIIEMLILKYYNTIILESLNLLIFKEFQFLSIILFVLLYLGLNIGLKIFTKKDVDYLISLFQENKKRYSIVLKTLNILKRVLKD